MYSSGYKLAYLDTNVVSDLCKNSDLILRFIKKFPPSEYLLSFSTFTFYEISKSELYEKFQSTFSAYPCAILKSHVPLIVDEIDSVFKKGVKVNPAFIIPLSLKNVANASGRNVMAQIMDDHAATTFINIDHNKELLFEEWSNLKDNQDFSVLFSQKSYTAKEFVARYRNYELQKRFFNGQFQKVEKKTLEKLHALEILAYGVYYKFISDPSQTKKYSDVLDILIMTTVPHVAAFVSEGNSIDILKKIKKQSKSLSNVDLLSISELRGIQIESDITINK